MTLKRLLASRSGRHLAVLAGYLLIAVVFTWPLVWHLRTHLPGSPDDDTGVYVWNLWVFQHEVLEHRSFPYFTDQIFGGTGRANLSLHNYTAFANLLALPFVQLLGVVATFNLVYLALTVLTAYAMFLLARRVTDDTAVAWLAGLLFAWSPPLMTRGLGHFSLVAAAPLPIFVLLLSRMHERGSPRVAIGLGATVAWATACDVYYGVFCVMLAVSYCTFTAVRVTRAHSSLPRSRRFVTTALDGMAIATAVLVLAIIVSGGWNFTLLGRLVQVQSLYTPVLVLTLVVVFRFALRYPLAISAVSRERIAFSVRVLARTAAVSAVLMSPLLFAFGVRVWGGRMASSRVFWRSSPPGIDAAALVIPNPNHPLAAPGLREWITSLARHDYLDNVASIPLIALAVLIVARRFGWRPPSVPAAITVGFGVLALGPFIWFAGVLTYVPTPWALLRYLPVVGMVRSPGRFLVVAMLGVAALFASALAVLVLRWPAARRPILAGIGVLLVAELLPTPRPLFSAAVPPLYRIVASDPREDARVLELPFGVRDGTKAAGHFRTRTQFYQTAHHKPILGGYLSRISPRRVDDHQRDPVLNALMQLSEGKHLTCCDLTTIRERWPEFVDRTSLAYVILHRDRGSEQLQALPAALGLVRVAENGGLTLYRPGTDVAPPDGSRVASGSGSDNGRR